MQRKPIETSLRLLLPVVLLLAAGCAGARTRPMVLIPPAALHEAPPPEAQALWQQAEQEQAAGKLNDAVATLERLAQRYPLNAIAARALSQLGKIYLDQGQPFKALRYYEYLLNTYPQWDNIDMARVDWLRALWAAGERKVVVQQAQPVKQRISKTPAKVALSVFMTGCFRDLGNIENGLDWLEEGYRSAQTAEERDALKKAGIALLQRANLGAAQYQLQRRPSDFKRIFIEYRLAQLEQEAGRPNDATNRLQRLLGESKNHPLNADIQAALQKAPAPGKPPTAPAPLPAGAPAVPGPPAPGQPPRVAAVPSEPPLPLNPSQIGCLVPTSGQYAGFGRQILRGLTMAADEYNQDHPDRPITIVTRDTRDDPETTARSFRELTSEQGVVAIIGPLSNQTLQAIAANANQLEVPVLALTQKEDGAPTGPYVQHVFLDNRQMVASLVRYCRSKLALKNFATLYPNDRYGQRLSKVFSEVVQEAGGNLLASVTYQPNSTDFQEPIQKLLKIATQNLPPGEFPTKGPSFDALFIPDQARTVALIAPQLPYHNVFGVSLLGTNLWSNPELVKSGGIYVEQAIFPASYFSGSTNRKVQRFEERFKELYQTDPSYLEAQAYDAMTLLLNAMERVRPPVQRSSVLERLLEIRNFDCLTGTCSFTPNGLVERRYTIMQINNGEIVPIAQ